MNKPYKPWMLVVTAGGIAAIALASGCAKGHRASARAVPPAAYQPPAPWTYTGRPVSEPLNGAVPTVAAAPTARLISEDSFTSTAPAPLPEGVAPAPVAKNPGELVKVVYTASNAPASEVIQVLVGQVLKRPFVVDPRLAAGTITLDVNEEMTRDEVIDFIGALASLYDWSIEDRDGVMMFRAGAARAKAPGAPVITANAAAETELTAVRVRKLSHASPDSVVPVMKELMSEGAKQFAVGRMIVLADSTRQLNRMSRLLTAIDTPSFEGVNVWTYRLGTRSPEDAAKILDTIAQTSRINPQGGADPLAAFVPVTGSDRLLVIARDPSLKSLVRTFIEQVDQPADTGRRERYLYRVQNFEPEKLVQFVANSMADKVETGASGNAAPGATRKPVRMVLEASERLVMIEASPADYAEVLALLKAVDRPKMQVFINSTIAEVALSGQLEFGVQYFFQGEGLEGLGIFGLTASPGQVTGPATGSIFFTAADGLALVQAIQREAKVEILSQPRVFVKDGFKATIDVGGETPVASSSSETPAQDQGNTLSRTDIEYKTTGVKLEIKPRINESGLIDLEITQENRVLTAPDTSTQAGQISPAFQTRRVITNVTVPNGRTIVLGGIIDDRKETRVAKVPLLGDLPLIGPAFQTTFDKKDRTELLLTITPTVIPEPTETVTQMSDFLRAAEAVRDVFANNADALPTGMLAHPVLEQYRAPEPAEEAAPAAEPAPAPAPAPAPGAEPQPAPAVQPQ